jgi:hypothetical protein
MTDEAAPMTAIVPAHVERPILLIRGERVLLDEDLAALCKVETRSVVRAVKRNPERFPPYFMFQLTDDETDHLRSQIVISSSAHGGRRYLPYARSRTGRSRFRRTPWCAPTC